MSGSYDVCIIGAGIVGLATAMKLGEAHPDLRMAVLDKEDAPATHQTGHNSGVIHSGIYYRPGSMKARMCISGAKELVSFCRENGIPYDLCGKVVVAVQPEEIPRLHALYERGRENGIPGLELVGPERIREIEPHVECLAGMVVPTTGIVNFRQVACAFADKFRKAGGRVLLNHRVTGIGKGSDGIHVETNRGVVSARVGINCAGLYSDIVARFSGMEPPCSIIPFRGEYYRLKPESRHMVKNLIYPVPDPRFPFLGVHFTRMIDNEVEAGPNAVLAWRREGYRRTDMDPAELLGTLSYPGFRRMARRYWLEGLKDTIRSFSKNRFVQSLRKLTPEIAARDLVPGGAGVRAQAVGNAGDLIDDFVIMRDKNMVHVLNAPSPAATSSLAVAGHITKLTEPLLDAKS